VPALAVDKARQNGLAVDINHLRVGWNGDFSASADRLEPACLDNDHGILDRWPTGAIDQPSTQYHEDFLGHVFPFLVLTITGRRPLQIG
jgi:hypothetical protein